MNLFELNENYRRLKDRDDIDPIALKDSLDAIDDDRQTKWDNLATWIDSNQANLDWLTKRIKELQRKKKYLTNQTKRLMDYLTSGIDDAGYKHVHTANHFLSTRKNPPTVIIDDSKKLPVDYVEEKIDYRPVKKRIREALKAGKQVPGAHLKGNRGTVIK